MALLELWLTPLESTSAAYHPGDWSTTNGPTVWTHEAGKVSDDGKHKVTGHISFWEIEWPRNE